VLCTQASLEAWESGSVGAYECYIEADDEELTAAEVYGGDEDEGNQLLSVAAVRCTANAAACVRCGERLSFVCDANAQAANTLNLVMRDEGTIKFVKYVSGQAPSSRWDVATVYEVDEDDSDEEGDDEDAGATAAAATV